MVLNQNGTSRIIKKTPIYSELKQIMVIRDACNSCGNCQTFCPETGDPQEVKTNIYINHELFKLTKNLDGYFIKDISSVLIRSKGIESEIYYVKENNTYHWKSETNELYLDDNNVIQIKNLDQAVSTEHFNSYFHLIIAKSILIKVNSTKSSYPFSFFSV